MKKCDDCDDGWLRDIKADGWIQCPKCRGTMWIGPRQDELAAIARRDETLRRQANAAPMARQPDDPGPTEIPQRMFDEARRQGRVDGWLAGLLVGALVAGAAVGWAML